MKEKYEGMSGSEILESAGLNWNVSKKSIYDESGNILDKEGYFRNVREDTGSTLGIVKARYEIFQNSELMEFAETLTGPNFGNHIQNAGLFKGGKKVFVNLEIPNDNQEYKDYLLFASSHDGSIGIEGLAHRIRIVCENTFNSALKNAYNKFSLKHTRNFRDKLYQAESALEGSLKYFSECNNLFEQLKNTPFTEHQLTELVSKVYDFEAPAHSGLTVTDILSGNDMSGNKVSTRKQNILNEIIELSHTGKGASEVKGTAYGAYNAITEYLDHYSTIRAHNDREEREVRQESIYNGSIAQKSQKALDYVLAMV